MGTTRPEPDGVPDCRVTVLGVPADKPIRNLVLTGPKEGRWEYVETGRWWRLAFAREDRRLDCFPKPVMAACLRNLLAGLGR